MFYVFKIKLGQKEKNVQGINKIQLKLENSPLQLWNSLPGFVEINITEERCNLRILHFRMLIVTVFV